MLKTTPSSHLIKGSCHSGFKISSLVYKNLLSFVKAVETAGVVLITLFDWPIEMKSRRGILHAAYHSITLWFLSNIGLHIQGNPLHFGLYE